MPHRPFGRLLGNLPGRSPVHHSPIMFGRPFDQLSAVPTPSPSKPETGVVAQREKESAEDY